MSKSWIWTWFLPRINLPLICAFGEGAAQVLVLLLGGWCEHCLSSSSLRKHYLSIFLKIVCVCVFFCCGGVYFVVVFVVVCVELGCQDYRFRCLWSWVVFLSLLFWCDCFVWWMVVGVCICCVLCDVIGLCWMAWWFMLWWCVWCALYVVWCGFWWVGVLADDLEIFCGLCVGEHWDCVREWKPERVEIQMFVLFW